jgi:hypothetical protein
VESTNEQGNPVLTLPSGISFTYQIHRADSNTLEPPGTPTGEYVMNVVTRFPDGWARTTWITGPNPPAGWTEWTNPQFSDGSFTVNGGMTTEWTENRGWMQGMGQDPMSAKVSGKPSNVVIPAPDQAVRPPDLATLPPAPPAPPRPAPTSPPPPTTTPSKGELTAYYDALQVFFGTWHPGYPSAKDDAAAAQVGLTAQAVCNDEANVDRTFAGRVYACKVGAALTANPHAWSDDIPPGNSTGPLLDMMEAAESALNGVG